MKKETLTLSIKFKLTRWKQHEKRLLSLCGQYSRCLQDGMAALIAQNEINISTGRAIPCKKCEGAGFDVNNLECRECQTQGAIEVQKPSGLTVSRRAMPADYPSNMKDSACTEVASTWRSYSALWDKQLKRSFPTFKGLGFRFRLRERSLAIDHERRELIISIPGRKLSFGYLGSKDMYDALKNCTTGAFDVLRSKKGDWFIRVFCKVTPKKKQNTVQGPIITVHTGMNFCVCALAAYRNGSFRFLFVPYFPLWGVKKQQKELRRSLQAKGKLRKVKDVGEKESRIANWYYHTVTKQLAEWIAEQRPRDVVLGEHKGIRSLSRKSNFKSQKKHNYWLSNYAFRSILEKLKYKLIMAGISYSTADTVKLMSTRTCSKCGGETFGLEKRQGRLCKDCGKTTSNEWNALKNLLPKSYRLLKRSKKPTLRAKPSWARCSVIESGLKRNLNQLRQRARQR